ncbi:MAG: DUF4258 domain-containing protein [Nitrososphaeria archaeon]
MTIIFTTHALERMKQRKISKEEVITCIMNSDKLEKIGEITKAVKRANDKVLVVYCRYENEDIVVITAYKSSRAQKYLR